MLCINSRIVHNYFAIALLQGGFETKYGSNGAETESMLL